jgi:hypothetical protein
LIFNPLSAIVVETLDGLPLQRQRVEAVAEIGSQTARLVAQLLQLFGRLVQSLVKIFHLLLDTPLVHVQTESR